MTTNLTPGKKARGGVSVRLSAYLDPEAERMLAIAQANLSGPALARLLGEALPGILAEKGFYEVACPRCGQASVEAKIKKGRKTDTWQCPKCGEASPFLEWQQT